jgi:hypothetical protein
MDCSAELGRNTCYQRSIIFRQNARTTLATSSTISLIEPAREDPLLSRIKESTLLSTWSESQPHNSSTNLINHGASSIRGSCLRREGSPCRSFRLQGYRGIWKDHWYRVLRLTRWLRIWLQPGHVRSGLDHEFLHQSSELIKPQIHILDLSLTSISDERLRRGNWSCSRTTDLYLRTWSLGWYTHQWIPRRCCRTTLLCTDRLLCLYCGCYRSGMHRQQGLRTRGSFRHWSWCWISIHGRATVQC